MNVLLGFNLLLGMDVIKKLGGVHIDEGGKAHFAEAAHTLSATIELEHLTFAQSSTNAPNPGQYHGIGPVISHQKSYTTEYRSTPSLQELVQNTIKSYKTGLTMGG